MRFSSFIYLIKEGFKNLFVNYLMSFSSIGVLMACLVLVGGSYLITVNVNYVVEQVEQQNELVIFLEDDATSEQKSAVNTLLDELNDVVSYRYISPQEALEEQMDTLGEDVLAGLEEDNPLPPSFRVKLGTLANLDDVIYQFSQVTGITKINAPTAIAGTLTNIKNLIYIFGIGIVVILALVSLVIITNTIRITVFSRRREINIMKYVGATNAFIRQPFVVEGALIGLFSSALAYGIIYFAYDRVLLWMEEHNISWLTSSTQQVLLPFSEVYLVLAVTFLVVGVFTGILGSTFSMRKYLKV